MKNIFVFFVLFTLFSCNDGSNLGNNYYYLPDYEAIDVGYPYGTIVYKSEEKNHFDEIIIYSHIKKIKFDDNYIIALQQPNKFLIKKRIKDDLELWNNYYSENKKDSLVSLAHRKILLSNIHNLIGSDKIEKLNLATDSIFNNEIFLKQMFQNKINYYIIEKVNDSIFGPLTQKEFETLKNKKKIDLDFE